MVRLFEVSGVTDLCHIHSIISVAIEIDLGLGENSDENMNVQGGVTCACVNGKDTEKSILPTPKWMSPLCFKKDTVPVRACLTGLDCSLGPTEKCHFTCRNEGST